jgi:hypothetical protein
MFFCPNYFKPEYKELPGKNEQFSHGKNWDWKIATERTYFIEVSQTITLLGLVITE